MNGTFAASVDKLKESFLFAAAQSGNKQDCESLIDIGADMNWANPDGDTPLLAACRRGHADTAELLIVHGANTNVKGRDGLNPLHISCSFGYLEIVHLLLEASCSLSATTPSGYTAEDLALQKGHHTIVERLKSSSPRRPSSSGSGITGIMSLRRSNNNRKNLPERVLTSDDNATSRSSESTNEYVVLSSPRLPLIVDASTHPQHPSHTLNTTSARSKTPRHTVSTEYSGGEFSNTLEKEFQAFAAGTAAAEEHLPGTSVDALKDQGNAYAIMGNNMHDDSNCVFKKRLELEQKELRFMEHKMVLAEEESMLLTDEVKVLQQQNLELESEVSSLQRELNIYHVGNKDESSENIRDGQQRIAQLSFDECEMVESRLRVTLEMLTRRKDVLAKEKADAEKDRGDRMCVVCQEKEKSVVLMPCRHLCLCDKCAANERLISTCPLCRREIVHRIGVYA